MKLQEQEFFATRAPEIANAANAAARKRLIAALPTTNPALWNEWCDALRESQGASQFMRESGRYPLCGAGDINTYAVFTELNRQLLSPDAFASLIIPSGIATDATTRAFFEELLKSRTLHRFYEFENEGFFAGIGQGHMVRFAVYACGGPNKTVDQADFVFQGKDIAELKCNERHFTLSLPDLATLNPNTRACPIFASRIDAELNKFIYRRLGVMWAEGSQDGNKWKLTLSAMFHMTNDSGLFKTQQELIEAGQTLNGLEWDGPLGKYVPVVEAKMVSTFNHRHGDFSASKNGERAHVLPPLTSSRLTNPSELVMPFYWAPKTEVEESLRRLGNPKWLLGWRDISDARASARCIVASVIGTHGVGNSFSLATSSLSPQLRACFYGALASSSLDYAARQKVGGLHVNFHIFKQLPLPTPANLESPAPWQGDTTFAEWLLPRVVELTYTAWDLEPFGVDCGYAGPPFVWDEERRFLLRAELDAAFFHLYLGTSDEWSRDASDALKSKLPTPRDAVSHILETFPIVKKKDLESFGTFRTKDTILS
ncbi:MAG: restriction endonuclease, partial [Betaproteobacteria bacterium]|nr:restriction endonuclease [Betaproteobacteria bacterium]